MDRSEVFHSVRKALARRGVTQLVLDGPRDESGLERIRKAVWGSDAHVILDGLMPHELGKLLPIFKDRKHFSMSMVDWWTSVYWFTRHADNLIFRNYNGIAARQFPGSFAAGSRPPWLFYPDSMARFAIVGSLLRPAALAAAPVIDWLKIRQLITEKEGSKPLMYFPFTITEDQVPLHSVPASHDFTNMGATNGLWLMRDPHVSAWLNFANLYSDRKRLINLLLQFEGQPFTVYDRRRNQSFLPWEELNRIIRGSRYMVCTGGLHHNSVPKFVEYACLGVPMIGSSLPYEYPWLEECIFPVDCMNISPSELKPKLHEALDKYPKLRENCLACREKLIRMYHPDAVLDMLQAQFDGKPVSPGYLKASANL